MGEEAFQAEVFKLRSREWPYYLQANRDVLPAVPDLSDLSGGLSNPAQFNFVSYILWKARRRASCIRLFASGSSCCMPVLGVNETVCGAFIAWAQVAARHVTEPEARTALTREAGKQLAQRVAPDALQQAASAPNLGAATDMASNLLQHFAKGIAGAAEQQSSLFRTFLCR